MDGKRKEKETNMSDKKIWEMKMGDYEIGSLPVPMYRINDEN